MYSVPTVRFWHSPNYALSGNIIHGPRNPLVTERCNQLQYDYLTTQYGGKSSCTAPNLCYHTFWSFCAALWSNAFNGLLWNANRFQSFWSFLPPKHKFWQIPKAQTQCCQTFFFLWSLELSPLLCIAFLHMELVMRRFLPKIINDFFFINYVSLQKILLFNWKHFTCRPRPPTNRSKRMWQSTCNYKQDAGLITQCTEKVPHTQKLRLYIP